MKNDDQCRIVIDSENLGDTCHMSVKTKNAFDEIIASARSSTGLIGGKTFKFESGLQGPASSLLAAIRLHSKNSSVYKKIHKKPTTLQILKDSLNNFFGLKEPGVSEFAQLFIKQTLSLAVRKGSRLPAAFSLGLKSENKVSSDEGLMAKMGYGRVNVDVNKVVKVSKLQYTTNSDGRVTSVSQPPKETNDLPHDKHYHAAVKMLLPYVVKSKKVTLKAQLNKSDSDLSIDARALYLKRSKQVDSYGKAYAFLSSHVKDKKKTKAASVVAAATQAANSCVNDTYINKKGHEVKSYMDLKLTYRRFFETLLGRRKSPPKRKSAPDEEDLKQEENDKSESSETPDMKRARMSASHIKFGDDDGMEE
jgi:hypothetical protein